MNFIDTYFRSGLYPSTLPAIVGCEAAGTVVALPTDPAVLNHPEFKGRGYSIGGKAVIVSTMTTPLILSRLSYLIDPVL